MRSTRKSQRFALALIGTVAAVAAPLTVSAPAWAAPAPATTTATVSSLPTQGQWKQINKIASAHSALGVADSGAVVRLAADTSAAAQAKVAAQLPAGAKTVVRTSKFSESKLNQIQKTVTARDWNSDADKYGVATSYDPGTDKVVVYTNAPASVTKSLTTSYPGALDVEQSRLEAQNSRFGDAQPFWGGAALVASESSGAYKCTAGFTVKERATGNLYMTTAGHCYSNLTHVYNRRADNSDGNWVGQVNRRNQSIDTEMIYASSSVAYGTDIYTGGTTYSESHAFVHGTEQPELGTQVCVSGSVSFNHCGHPISNTHFSICYSGGSNCITNGRGFLYDRGGTYPSYDNGQLTQGGDSGAPIYTEDYTQSAAWIVGSHSGLIYQGENACGCSKPHMVGVNVYSIVQAMGVDVITK
ncbi:hypothetical protein ACIO13_14395 [Streptomyces sp. NPDC087425]|uniref:hypothetical protein n=1 Tax=Streptomyces sp. NPDC087425 TaxID=3365787 RepID=UPI0037F95576